MKYGNKQLNTLKIIILSILLAVTVMPFAGQVSTVRAATENLDINSSGFKIMFCDGPAGVKNLLASTSAEYKNFVTCDFIGLMGQVKRLINVMIILGVVAAIIGFCYAGYLYITGVPNNITKAHDIFKKVGLGFVLMLGAWTIVYQILTWLSDNSAVKGLLN